MLTVQQNCKFLEGVEIFFRGRLVFNRFMTDKGAAYMTDKGAAYMTDKGAL